MRMIWDTCSCPSPGKANTEIPNSTMLMKRRDPSFSIANANINTWKYEQPNVPVFRKKLDPSFYRSDARERLVLNPHGHEQVEMRDKTRMSIVHCPLSTVM